MRGVSPSYGSPDRAVIILPGTCRWMRQQSASHQEEDRLPCRQPSTLENAGETRQNSQRAKRPGRMAPT